MVDRISIHHIIDEAIQCNSAVFIRYRDYHGNVSERKISPLEWVESEKILAFCHLRNDQRNFNTANIIEISKEEFLPSSKIEQPVIYQSQDQPVITRLAPRPARTPQPPQEIRLSFSKVTNADEWKRLLSYYHECLNHEYQQQFSMGKNALFPLVLDESAVYSFLTGTHNLQFNLSNRTDRLREFLDNSHRRNQQLCLGKSFVCLSAEKISPLLFVPINVEQGTQNVVVLKPEDYSFSYAALMNLGFDADEIADFLDSYQAFVEDQPSVEDVEKYIIQTLSERLSRPLPIFSHEDHSLSTINDYSIFDGAGLFWANSEFTGNLISELKDLSDGYKWQGAPEIVQYLFNQLPDHEHAPAPEFIEDQHFYVTNINAQQRKAARAVSEHPVTIITGPPGTGKSQLVLNLIAQAYLDGKTVLFASHNNKAVDVVMDRLQGETRFQGAIRTGSRQNRKHAVEQMESAIAQVHQPAIQDFENRYKDGKRILKEANDRLDLIRDLKGKIQSYQLELRDVLEKLPLNQRERFSALNLPFIEADKLRLTEFLSTTIDEFKTLIYKRQQLVALLRETLLDQEKKQPAVQIIREYEVQWGRFAGGLLHKDDISSLSDLACVCTTWTQILNVLSDKNGFIQAQHDFQQIKKQIDQHTEGMTEELTSASLQVENRMENGNQEDQQRLIELERELEKIKENHFTFIQKIASALHLINPKKKFIEKLQGHLDRLEIKSYSLDAKTVTAEYLQEAANALAAVIGTGGLLHEMQHKQHVLSQSQAKFETSSKDFLPDTLAEFDRLNLRSFEAAALVEIINSIERQAKEAMDALTKAICQCINLFIENNSQVATIQAFEKTVAVAETWDAFSLNQSMTEGQAYAWTQMWQRLIVIWEANAIILHSQGQLACLPKEEEALSVYQDASQSLFTLAGDLMRATWHSRTSEVPNITYQGTQKYTSAVKQLNDLDFGKEPYLYPILKEAERINFPYALQMFPVWAITNLTARTNFPLQPGLFDLLIIDEASQCDIPSALPLLYRAKKVVIIGDPNQLRHVATLATGLDKQIGFKYGVGLEALSYSSHSLYDLGERSVGFHPGAILLDEHYRSDPRIITFSNEEFYGSQLKIKTDLTRRGYDKDYLNKRGGASWLNVKGELKRPPNGSAYNTEELKQIQLVVPQILQSLDKAGYRDATIGVVTPFRAQETKIREWISQTYPGSKRIKSGTAHQFQGDECDIIVFSPVLAAGIPEGTLNWLEETYNLLNVAITRARVSLIIIGDFDYCYTALPAKSRYNRLAKYLKDRLNGVYASAKDFPLLGGEKFEILGTLLDPSNPEFNRTNLIRFIASCQDYLYWIDPYFDQGIIDLMDELFENDPRPALKKIRMITAERQVKFYLGKPPLLRPESVVRLKEYLEEIGVDFELRVLPGEDLPHDRFLYHPGGAINMPPFAGAYGKHRHVSEYTPSQTTIEDFDKYWKKGIPIEDL